MQCYSAASARSNNGCGRQSGSALSRVGRRRRSVAAPAGTIGNAANSVEARGRRGMARRGRAGPERACPDSPRLRSRPLADTRSSRRRQAPPVTISSDCLLTLLTGHHDEDEGRSSSGKGHHHSDCAVSGAIGTLAGFAPAGVAPLAVPPHSYVLTPLAASRRGASQGSSRRLPLPRSTARLGSFEHTPEPAGPIYVVLRHGAIHHGARSDAPQNLPRPRRRGRRGVAAERRGNGARLCRRPLFPGHDPDRRPVCRR